MKKTPTVYRCSRCGCRVTLYVDPSCAPVCTHPGTGHRPIAMTMVVDEPVTA